MIKITFEIVLFLLSCKYINNDTIDKRFPYCKLHYLTKTHVVHEIQAKCNPIPMYHGLKQDGKNTETICMLSTNVWRLF